MDFRNDDGCTVDTPPKRHCSFIDAFSGDKKFGLQELPREILVQILCGVDHDDLKRLFFVSKTIREVALIAKGFHFAYCTPAKTIGFRNVYNIGDLGDVEVPNAPKQSRLPWNRVGRKKLLGIAVALFATDDDEV